MPAESKDLAPLLDSGTRLRLLVLVLASVVGAMLEMLGIAAVPAFLAILLQVDEALRFLPRGISALLPEPGNISVTAAAAALAAFFLVKNLFLAGLAAFDASVMRRVTVTNTARLFEGYVRGPYALHLDRNPSELIKNVNYGVTDAVEYLRNSTIVLREGLILLVTLGLLVAVAPVSSVGIMGVLSIAVVLFLGLVRRALGEWGVLAQRLYAKQLKTLNETLGAVKSIRVAGNEGYFVSRFLEETEQLWTSEYRHRFVSTLPRLFLEFIAVVAVLGVALFFMIARQNVEEMLLSLALIVVAVVRLVPAFNAITAALANMRYYRGALRATAEELRMVSAREEREQLLIPRISERVELQDIHFRYPGSRQETLTGVSLTITAGEVIGIVGPTGAGKSTLVDVLLGLLEPTSGSVVVDGRDIRTGLRSWQDQIGYVPQDIYLTDDSIRRNIGFGLADEAIDNERLERAVFDAHLSEFVASLPEGLDTEVGNRGVRLSGGQRQRIGIARALYSDPPVLVLDEATSSLDHETEAAVIDCVERLKGSRTIIIIAHRQSTLAPCRRIHHIRAGRLVREEPSVVSPVADSVGSRGARDG
jgi:ATP-binding cassette, subfamily B, bacterial PglK